MTECGYFPLTYAIIVFFLKVVNVKREYDSGEETYKDDMLEIGLIYSYLLYGNLQTFSIFLKPLP